MKIFSANLLDGGVIYEDSAKRFRTTLQNAVKKGVSLAGADLSNEDLSGMEFYKLDLSGARLKGATLSGCALVNVDLSGANLQSATLSGVTIRDSKFINSDLSFTDITHIYANDCDFSSAGFFMAKIRDSSVYISKFDQANLQSSNLDNAAFVTSCFAGADFRGCISSRSTFFDGSIFTQAKIEWGSHSIISEILKREAGSDVNKLMAALS